MSAPESIINSLWRAGNLSTKDIQSIVSSFQALPKQIDEDVDIELNMYDPETRDRIESHVINPGPTTYPQAQTRNRNGSAGYIRNLPTTVNIFPSVHTQNGTINMLTDDLKFGGGAAFTSGAYTTLTDNTRFNPTDELTLGGWYKFKQVESGDSFGHIIGKDSQYGLFVLSESFGVNKVYSQVTIGSVNKQTSPYEFTPDTWIHIMATWKSPNLKFYVDGVLDDTLGSATGVLDTTSNMFSLGANHAGFIPVKTGTVFGPQVALHKEASAAWILDHYNGILDTSGTNVEIVTYPMVAHVRPMPDASVGRCIVT